MSNHLEAIYHYAQENWSTVGSEWVELFTSSEADRIVQKKLEATEAALRSGSDKSTKKASTDKATQVPSSAQETNKPPGRVLILAVDEARSLLSRKYRGIDYIRLLHRALVHANERIRASQPTGGIFAVLVDTNSKVAGVKPPLWSDSSSRSDGAMPALSPSLFPPFVLSHTMDVYWRRHSASLKIADEISVYKFVVTQSSVKEARDAFISMGRPMWASTFRAWMIKYREANGYEIARREAIQRVLSLAKRKLLLGCDPSNEASYNDSTMFGVASMLRRLGLRSHSSSMLATRIVADLMAILAYVNHENDSQLSCYSSDPVLALGATHVWYALNSALTKYILPQFKKMLLHEILDAGDVGVVVARIVLLLAMDTCVVMKTEADNHRRCKFTGQFVSVQSFMKALGGAEPPVMTSKQARANPETVGDFNVWRSQWDGWEMGFCHFVQLDLEPTEETLWFLLGRRAAGVLPRNKSGADLVIPMYFGSEVSLILIQMKNVEGCDREFPRSATVKMDPSFVFAAKNPLSAKAPRDVICVYMSLREPVSGNDPDRFFLAELNGVVEPRELMSTADSPAECSSDTTPPGATTRGETVPDSAKSADPAASQSSNDAFTLCIRSLRPSELVVGTVTHPVISEAVAPKLADLASSRWDAMGMVNSDLRDRSAMEEKLSGSVNNLRLSPVMPDDELVAVASRTLEPGCSRRDDEGDDDCVEIEGKPAAPMDVADAPASSDQQSRSPFATYMRACFRSSTGTKRAAERKASSTKRQHQ